MALFEKHIHYHCDNSRVVELLQIQAVQISKIMATFQDFQDQLTRIGAATENIAADLVRLADQIAKGGLTTEEETEISDALKLAAEKLEAVAAVNPEPTPEPPVAG